ncbi:MAG: flagellar biosynthetic protein FliO [Acetanaerobacterium sp.]
MEEFLSVAGAILMVVAIVVLAFYSTKWLGKRMGGAVKSRYLSVIDRVSLGQDKYIAVVKVGEKHLLIGVSSGSVTNLGELSQDDLTQVVTEQGAVSFGDAFKESMKKYGTFGVGKRDKEHD